MVARRSRLGTLNEAEPNEADAGAWKATAAALEESLALTAFDLPGHGRSADWNGQGDYTALCAAGYFPEDWLATYMQNDSRLNGHPNRNYLPGVETNTGPVGHGFPVAVGIAIAGALSGRDYRTFVLTGDGEQQEGSNWEAAMVAAHRGLRNLTLIVDRNRLQQGAGTEETSSLDPLDQKYAAFGFDVQVIDGHDIAALLAALTARSTRPRCLIANTAKGKGVSFMENVAKWHHGVPSDAEYASAMAELV